MNWKIYQPISRVALGLSVLLSQLPLDQANAVNRSCVRNSGDAVQCMACNLVNEAGGEGDAGMLAVGKVVMNRVKSPGWPKSVCGVIWQNAQFSWTLKKIREISIPSGSRGDHIMALARKAISAGAGNADHYHASYVKPKWAKRCKRVSKVGAHIFYNCPGGGYSGKVAAKSKKASYKKTGTVSKKKKVVKRYNPAGKASR